MYFIHDDFIRDHYLRFSSYQLTFLLFIAEKKNIGHYEQVKRNIKCLPGNFMLKLTERERNKVGANCDHLQDLKYPPYHPYVFTEHGTIALANVLNIDRALRVSIRMKQLPWF